MANGRRTATSSQSTAPKVATTASTSDKVVAKRTYLRQVDVPIASLDDALRIPRAIFDHYAGKPTAPLSIARAMDVDPKGSQIRVLSGAAIAFGLIDNGAQAATIGATDLARRIVRPKVEGDDLAAMREAVLKPRILGEFLRRYDGNQFPREDIALNVLEDIGVPREKVADVLLRIVESATAVGFMIDIKGKRYVQIAADDGDVTPSENAGSNREIVDPTLGDDDLVHSSAIERTSASAGSSAGRGGALTAAIADDQRRKRVFITHGKDRALVDPIKKLLEYGEMEPVVSVERQSVSKPVPEKILDDMRRCGAAIIHVDAEAMGTDKEGNDLSIINSNVLIEIGAAMAFYGRRFILLVRTGVRLPSNLQGLYEVRYSGESLDAEATIKLLEAMKDIKNHALPTDASL